MLKSALIEFLLQGSVHKALTHYLVGYESYVHHEALTFYVWLNIRIGDGRNSLDVNGVINWIKMNGWKGDKVSPKGIEANFRNRSPVTRCLN